MVRKPVGSRISKTGTSTNTPVERKTAQTSVASPRGSKIARLFGPKSLTWIQYQLSNGGYVSPEQLAVVIEGSPAQPLPDDIREYVCRMLRGKVKRKRGPTKSNDSQLTEIVAAAEYRKELERIQKQRAKRGAKPIRGEMAPHEMAANTIKERFKIFASMSPRGVANLFSSRKTGR